MSCFLSKLGHRIGRDFWASYKSLLKKKKEKVGVTRNKTGEILYEKSEICTQFETTFFSGKHLSKQSYDKGFFEHVEQEVRVADSSDEHENDLFVDPLNIEKLNAAIANTSNTSSFDTDGIHLSIIKKMGYKAREMLLQSFNNCWETASLPWKESRVIFVRKLNKKKKDVCSFSDLYPSPVTLVIFLNKFSPGELKNISTCTTSLVKNKNASERKKNTVRKLNRLHLSLELAKAQNFLQPCLI